ncbi:MAG: tRNA (adenosine(37)-N6)-threonylcarbamoyltransferase complex dimerization subunit type 1 TsaB [Candidatus Binatia bacterium]|nr:tRNA (adenosine(37)-N6)-threonylcarbamoyltransferase complex dimerization subunit type 1 TsaB [Candidatus Binatia bacterium]
MSGPTSLLRVVGIDTATRAGSVGLVEESHAAPPKRLAEVAHEEELRHAETLLPAIDQCLEQAGCALGDVHGFAVSIGPGSFTGLRVGLATAKGLALATGAWLVGVSTLEAYAHTEACRMGRDGSGALICVCLDARKGEVYSALFRAAGPTTAERVLADAVEKPASAAARMGGPLMAGAGACPTLRVVGDGGERYPDEILAALGRRAAIEAVPQSPEGRGFAVAELGLRYFRADGPADTAYLAPTYLRASEAELKLRERRSGGTEQD